MEQRALPLTQILYFFLIALTVSSCGDGFSDQRAAGNKFPRPTGIDSDGRAGDFYIGSCQTKELATNDITECQEWLVVRERQDMYTKVVDKCNANADGVPAGYTPAKWEYQPCPHPVKKTVGGCVYPAVEQVSGITVGELVIWQYVEERDFSQDLVNSLKEACEGADNSSEFRLP